MDTPSTAVWEAGQDAAIAQSRRESRECRKNFVLVFLLVALTVAFATLLARLGTPGA
jgi:hypothetical protein